MDCNQTPSSYLHMAKDVCRRKEACKMLQFLGLCHHFQCPIALAPLMHCRCNGCLEQCGICAISLINVKETYNNLNPTCIMWFDQTFWSSRLKMMSGGRGQGGSWICLTAFNNSTSELRYIINIDSMLISSILFSAMNAAMMFMTPDIFVQCNEKVPLRNDWGWHCKNATFIMQGLYCDLAHVMYLTRIDLALLPFLFLC